MEMNTKMQSLFCELHKNTNKILLPNEILTLLRKGMRQENGCLFLSALKELGSSVSASNFEDRPGYECFINKIHLDDYIDKDYLLYAILYCREILSMNAGKQHLKIIVSIDDQSCVVRFHILRKDESWLGEDLEKYLEEALLVLDLECSEDIKFLNK